MSSDLAAGAYDGGATWYRTQEVEGQERGCWGFSNPDVVELGPAA